MADKPTSCIEDREYYVAHLRPLVEALYHIDDCDRGSSGFCSPQEFP
jgi:hypothetical protein